MATAAQRKTNGKKPQPRPMLNEDDAAALQLGRSALESATKQTAEYFERHQRLEAEGKLDARTQGALHVLGNIESLRGTGDDDWRDAAIAREIDGWRDRIARLTATIEAVEHVFDEGVSCKAMSGEILAVAAGVRSAVAGAEHELGELLVFAGRLEAFADMVNAVERFVDVHVPIEAEKRAAKQTVAP